MRYFFILVSIGILGLIAPAFAQSPGDTCSTAGAMVQRNISGTMTQMVCDGSVYRSFSEKNGAKSNLQIANDTGSCISDKEGRLRYDPGADAWEYCDSVGNWSPLFTPPVDCTNGTTGECLLAVTRSTSDPDFTASNIANGVNILGVTGSLGNSTAYLEGLVGHWPFDDGPGSTIAADASGFGNDGVLTNMDPSTDWVSGQIGGALEFDGNNDIVLIDDNNIFDMTYSLTISAWMYPTANGSPDGTLLMKGDSTLSYILFHETLGGDWYGMINGKTFRTNGPSNTVWTHLAMTYDGSEVNLYRNGVVVHTEPYTNPIAVTNDPVQIGRNIRWGDPYTGKIDDVRLYNRALSSSEVNTLYNSGL